MKLLLAALLTTASLNGFAETVNIDFQSIENVSDVLVLNQGFIYTEDGFTLTTPFDNNGVGFATSGTLSSNYKGSTALFNNTGLGITLTKSDAGAFTLNSIDLAGILNDPVDVTFTGTKSDASTINQRFTGPSGLFIYIFVGFTDLLSVEWIQASPFHQFDNINLTSADVNNGGNPSAVPLPAAAWLFGSAALGFFGLRRKNQV